MRANSASRYLAEFSDGHSANRLSTFTLKPDLKNAELLREREISSSYDRGVIDGQSTAHAEMAAALLGQRQEFDAALARERTAWVEAEADKLTNGLASGLVEIETRMSDVVGRLLRPLLEHAVRQRAISDLRATVSLILRSAGSVAIKGTIASDLIDAIMRSELAPLMSEVKALEGDTEIRLQIDETIVETRIAEWVAEITRSIA